MVGPEPGELLPGLLTGRRVLLACRRSTLPCLPGHLEHGLGGYAVRVPGQCEPEPGLGLPVPYRHPGRAAAWCPLPRRPQVSQLRRCQNPAEVPGQVRCRGQQPAQLAKITGPGLAARSHKKSSAGRSRQG